MVSIREPCAYGIRNGFVIVAQEHNLKRPLVVRCVTQTEGCPVTVRVSMAEPDLEGYEENTRIIGKVYILWEFASGMRSVVKAEATTVDSDVGKNRLGEGSESGARIVRVLISESIFAQGLFDGWHIVRFEYSNGPGDSGTPMVSN